jgi:hypothetical protein
VRAGGCDSPRLLDLRDAASGRKRAEQAAYERGVADADARHTASLRRAHRLAEYQVPRGAEALFDPAEVADDPEKWTARAEQLRAAGLDWGWVPEASPEQAEQAQEQQEQQARDARAEELAASVGALMGGPAMAAGSGGQGDLLSRVARDPASLKPEELGAFEAAFNANMAALTSRPGAGILT